ncbi:MAG: hypothetical protein JWN72_1458 [Thermoleophilia bacterium]|nr:hypothetical protein [Thermoleophilia bacterium]
MSPHTAQLLGAAGLLLLFILFALGMFVLAVRFGPKRGTWNQPAAKLRRPGRRLTWMLHAVTLLHVVAGIVLAVKVPGGGAAVLVVLIAMACFYELCAYSFSLATSVAARRQRPS